MAVATTPTSQHFGHNKFNTSSKFGCQCWLAKSHVSVYVYYCRTFLGDGSSCKKNEIKAHNAIFPCDIDVSSVTFTTKGSDNATFIISTNSI